MCTCLWKKYSLHFYVSPCLQFDVTNTLNDQLLENVRVEMEMPDNFAPVTYVPIPKLPYNQPGTTYTLVEMENTNAGWKHACIGVAVNYKWLPFCGRGVKQH